MFKSGEWLSIAIVGLVTLFVVTSVGFFNFLIGPNGSGPSTTVEPSSAYTQVIFISLAPAIALSFFSGILSEGSRLSAFLILGSGVILILGMFYISNLIPLINDVDLPWWISNAPWIFSVFGVLLLGIGYLRLKKVSQSSTKSQLT